MTRGHVLGASRRGDAETRKGSPRSSVQPSSRRTRTLLYLYCIVESGTEAHQLLDSGQIPGLDPEEPLFAIEGGGLVAAVSRVPAATFGERPLNALVSDLPRLTPFAVHHEAVVRALLPAAAALVPMTFGAVYRTAERVEDLLRRRGEELQQLLASVRDKQEWSLKVFADPQSLAQVVQSESPTLRNLAKEAESAGPGRAYLLQKRRQRAVDEEAEQVLARAVADVFQRLSASSAGAYQEEVPGAASQVPGQGGDAKRETQDERLVLKAAFLVEASAVEPFQQLARELESSYGEHGLSLELSGPWAAYSFVKPVSGPETRRPIA